MRRVIKRSEWDRYYYFSKQHFFQKRLEKESLESETSKVRYVLEELESFGLIPSTEYTLSDFLKFRSMVHDTFFIYWTAINPPMEHLLFALSEILKPRIIMGIGIFTGNPVVWSMGPALMGQYKAERLTAVEIVPEHAKICDENFKKLIGRIKSQNNDESRECFDNVQVLAEDGFEVLKGLERNYLDLLYLDANGYDPDTGKSSKNINTTLLKRGYSKIKHGGYAMCHNAYMPSFKKQAPGYLKFTNDERFFDKTATCAIDEMGLEVSRKV